MAFVFVNHADPKVVSALPQILSRCTKMKVTLAADGVVVRPDTVYVAPPASQVSMGGDRLRVEDLHATAPMMPIDLFFRSLAEEAGNRAIAVVLSGAASDGALGTKAVKAEGGITFAQDRSARFESMPQSAVTIGSVDFVLAPAQIAKELTKIGRHAYLTGAPPRLPEADVSRILALVHARHDVDFSQYKPSTVERRIRRRMALHKMEAVHDYVRYIEANPEEVEELYADILIRVTNFFRDPQVFETLKRDVLPGMLLERTGETPVRIWVAGCATGEEVYSLAICVLELANAHGLNVPVQIFGTDVSESAIEKARAGIYPENILVDVSPDRLRRYFTKVDGQYRVSKQVRDCCIFARQNLTKDPPFSKIDLISCRNVMIYLGAALQRKAMSVFHFALRPEGCLLLGSSETIGSFADMFSVADRRHKIFRKRGTMSRTPMTFDAAPPPQQPMRSRPELESAAAANLFREADRVLLSRYVPPGVLVNENMEILQFRGRTSPFLEPAPGTASFNLLKMAREGLLGELRTALHNARKKDAPVRRELVRVKHNGKPALVTIEVIPFLTASRERYSLVVFEESPEPVVAKKSRETEAKGDSQKVARLKRELEATREYLQSIIEEQEAMNEELRSANEEIQSSNEELQSTNEELETAKEELQSSNEELTTLNEELEQRNEELGRANNDLVNLLASVDIPIVMLDVDMRIRRFNPGAQRILNLIPADIGRLLADLKTTLKIDNFDDIISSVINDLRVREVEVEDRNGHWYLVRVRPYKTTENRIEGAVMVMIEKPALAPPRGAQS